MVFNILIVMGLGFIGLHAGSKFKRAPKPWSLGWMKTRKTD